MHDMRVVVLLMETPLVEGVDRLVFLLAAVRLNRPSRPLPWMWTSSARCWYVPRCSPPPAELGSLRTALSAARHES